MNNVITIGRRLIPLDQIAFIEPFDATTATGIETSRKFAARINLLSRDNCLTEASVESFAVEHKFRLLPEDAVALNPTVDYRVEMFEPTEGFTPTKAFKTRLLWRDHRGNDHSKLLLTAPEQVLAAVTEPQDPPAAEPKAGEPPARNNRRRAASKRPARQPA